MFVLFYSFTMLVCVVVNVLMVVMWNFLARRGAARRGVAYCQIDEKRRGL
jgi:hypothetical protein